MSRTGEYYYELFKIHRDTTGDIQKLMAYLNHAIGYAMPQEWVYLFEMSLFIKQVRKPPLYHYRNRLQAFRLKQDAQVLMKRVLEKDPLNSKVWYEAACLAEEMCEYDIAQTYLQRAISLDPQNTIIFLKIAQILFSLKRHKEAISCLEEALIICQRDLNQNGGVLYTELAQMLSLLHGQLGMIYSHLDENEKAYNYINQAITFDETNGLNWINLASLEMKLGRGESCMQICEKILTFDSTNERAIELKGDLHHRCGQIDQAFMYYKKAIEVNPESHSAISSMGDLLRHGGKLKEAIDHYKKALSVRVDLADTFSKLCNAKMHCCDWEQQDECYSHLFNLVSK